MRAQENLAQMSDGRTTVEQFFDGPDGMLGIVGLDTDTDDRFIAWASADGNALVIGPVLSNGKNLTAYYEEQILGERGDPITRQGAGRLSGTGPTKAQPPKTSRKQHAPSPAVSSSDGLLRNARQATALTLGDSDKHLYMFHDPFCGFCSRAKHALLAPIDAGKVTVSFIPVGVLGTRSEHAAAALIAADTREALMKPGSDLKDASRSASDMNAAKTNTALLAAMGRRVATPSFVFIDKSTGEARMTQGLPADMDEMIGQIEADHG